jgi:hypothetical protein
MQTSRRNQKARFLAGSLVAVASAFGCQFLVPNDLPAFSCAEDSPSACPTGSRCDVGAGRCVEVTVDPPDAPPPDARPDAPEGPRDVGGRCTDNASCKAGLLCGTSTILTAAITRSGSVCTKPCCTSADCPNGFVCYATGTGGTYCVGAEAAGRPLPRGAGAPGSACSDPASCRSGLCASGRCLDTCCRDGDCATGSVCGRRSMDGPGGDGGPLVTHIAWACTAPMDGGLENGDTNCVSNAECKNNNCATVPSPNRRCNPSCCSSADCSAFGGTCIYARVNTGGDYIKWCGSAPGASDNGTACTDTTGAECKSRYCDVALDQCAKPCCTDADCATNEACRPSPEQTPFLRCVAK